MSFNEHEITTKYAELGTKVAALLPINPDVTLTPPQSAEVREVLREMRNLLIDLVKKGGVIGQAYLDSADKLSKIASIWLPDLENLVPQLESLSENSGAA